MNFGYKTVILGGNTVGVLSVENNDGLKGKLKTSLKGDDVFLALLASDTLALIPSADFGSFALPPLDVNNLNAYIIKGDRILSHGKTASLRPSDTAVLDKIRRYRYEHSTIEKIDKDLPQHVSDGTTKISSNKNPISDYFLDICRYDDDAIAEVNYYDNKPFSHPVSPFIADALSETAAVASVESDKKPDVFVYPDDNAVLPSDLTRSFLSRDFALKSQALPRENIRRSRSLKRRGKVVSETVSSPSSARKSLAETVKSIPVVQKTGSTADESVEGVAQTEADFFEEVAAQIDTLMKTYPHEETLERMIPDSRFAIIPLAEGGSYIIGAVSSLYIIYGVPGTRDSVPRDLKGAAFISTDEENDNGYWVLFQDAATGKSISVELNF